MSKSIFKSSDMFYIHPEADKQAAQKLLEISFAGTFLTSVYNDNGNLMHGICIDNDNNNFKASFLDYVGRAIKGFSNYF